MTRVGPLEAFKPRWPFFFFLDFEATARTLLVERGLNRKAVVPDPNTPCLAMVLRDCHSFRHELTTRERIRWQSRLRSRRSFDPATAWLLLPRRRIAVERFASDVQDDLRRVGSPDHTSHRGSPQGLRRPNCSLRDLLRPINWNEHHQQNDEGRRQAHPSRNASWSTQRLDAGPSPDRTASFDARVVTNDLRKAITIRNHLDWIDRCQIQIATHAAKVKFDGAIASVRSAFAAFRQQKYEPRVKQLPTEEKETPLSRQGRTEVPVRSSGDSMEEQLRHRRSATLDGPTQRPSPTRPHLFHLRFCLRDELIGV